MEESNQQEQANNDAETSRSYGCVFCKRGFTTAQALGGHMNVHRRDKAKTKQIEASSVSNIPDSSPISSHPAPPASEAKRSYQAYLPFATSNARYPRLYHANESHTQRTQQPSDLYGEDWSTALSLQIGSTQLEQSEKEKKQKKEEDQLDLELRLGHDP